MTAATATNYMAQYHAMGLLYQMRSHDRMALVKMVQQYSTAGAVKSPAARVMLVRLAAKLAEDDPAGLRKPMMKLLDDWLRDKSEMVNFEAAKAICNMPDLADAEVGQAIHVLQLFLTSPRAVTKFAAIRILHQFASFKPDAVRQCNPDIEALISNTNRSIATFAITTLLKTGNEASVDRLMKQISTFMSDITDEFKVTVVEAIRTLCLKFPNKQAGMLAFLSGILRDEGGFEFKRSVVESIFDLIKFVPESKEEALAHLCEFIEDCEFTKLAVRILHLLGMEGPKTAQPTKYIRYIYNRVVLENAIVRAAAVTALAKFGVGQKDKDVKASVEVLLRRCLDDTDDEVRDRAALNLRLMKEEDDEVAGKFVRNGKIFPGHVALIALLLTMLPRLHVLSANPGRSISTLRQWQHCSGFCETLRLLECANRHAGAIVGGRSHEEAYHCDTYTQGASCLWNEEGRCRRHSSRSGARCCGRKPEIRASAGCGSRNQRIRAAAQELRHCGVDRKRDRIRCYSRQAPIPRTCCPAIRH